MNSRQRFDLDKLSQSVKESRSNQDYEQALFGIQYNAASRAISKRRNDERKEMEMIEKLEKEEEERRRRDEQIRIEQEARKEEAEKIRQNFHDLKMRQKIREENHSLRDLERKLRMAYVLKGLAAQQKEKDALKIAEKLQVEEENNEIEKERMKHIQEEEKKRELDREKKKKLREDLRNQVISNHQQRQILYEQFLREKSYLDEITIRVQQELFEEVAKKMKLREQSKRDIEVFRIAKEEIERIQKIEMEEENKRIFEYCQARDKKIAEEEERRKELEQKRETLNKAMVKELTELNDKKIERERLLQELWAFEQNEKIEEKIRNQLEYRLKLAVESRMAIESQLHEQKQRREREELEEKAFYENQLQLLAERDKLEQLSNERRRRKIAEHRRAVQEMLEERKVQRVETVALEMKARDAEVEAERRKQAIVEEERIKIIQEHAQSLIGFLPKEILRESDKINFSFAADKKMC